jgi:RNA polymerase sigma-70 factor (ECF subfamily)
MLRVAQGDEQAFNELRDRYAVRILGLLLRVLHHRAESEDALQEVFLRLYRSRHRYQPRAGFATWIFHIAHNVARNALRRRRRKPLKSMDFHEPANHGIADRQLQDCARPDAIVERNELAERVRQAVASLGGRAARALQLHQLQGLSYIEVAAELEITPKAAKSLLYRARNQLREQLADMGDELAFPQGHSAGMIAS